VRGLYTPSRASSCQTPALAFEWLNDWKAIFRVVKPPERPLTNNAAEQALRHWVIASRIMVGTLTVNVQVEINPQGGLSLRFRDQKARLVGIKKAAT